MKMRFICFSIVAAAAFALAPLFGIQQSGSAAETGVTGGSVKYIQGSCPAGNDRDIAPESSEQPGRQGDEESKVQSAGILLAGSYEYEKVESRERTEDRSFSAEYKGKINALSPRDRKILLHLGGAEREAALSLSPREIHVFLNLDPKQREAFVSLEPSEREVIVTLSPDLRRRFFTLAPWERDFFITLGPAERRGFFTLKPEERHGFYKLTPEERRGFFAPGGAGKRRELSERAQRGEFNKGREAERGEPQGLKPQGKTGTGAEKNVQPEGKAPAGAKESTTPREREKGEPMSGMKSKEKPAAGAEKNVQPEGKASPDNGKKESTSSSGRQ